MVKRCQKETSLKYGFSKTVPDLIQSFIEISVARIQRGRILSVLISIWVFSLFWTVSPLVGWNGYELEPYRLTCSIRWYGHVDSDRAYICLVLLCVYVFPLSVMIFSYIQIARHARRLSCTYPSSNEGGNKAKFLYNLERGATKAR